MKSIKILLSALAAILTLSLDVNTNLSYAKAAKAPTATPLAREDDPIWNTFVLGDVADLPESPIKEFLTSCHHNNPYAKTISALTQTLGPFSPEADHVFWIPTLDLPMTKENWRFLSSLSDVPSGVLHLTTYQQKNATYLRMFLHPYSTEEPVFKKLATEYGGFKYEFQGATTASVRSLIAWKSKNPKPENDDVGKIEFPKDPDSFIWPKVSITRTDIDGSRLNPAKKMVRAYAVTRLMNNIPEKTKKEVGFEFAGEWVVGVPKGTDAGYVTREIVADFFARDGSHVEPGFSILSPKRLQELAGDMAHADTWIKENILRPVLRPVSYMMMVEGMFGEYHNQNFNYVVARDGHTINKVLFHDADAFRTSILLRALNRKETGSIRQIDAPFYYMKDSVFLQSADAGEAYGLDSLMESYFSNAGHPDTVAGFIKTWCSKIKAYKPWCTNENLRRMVTDTFAEELSPYVGHAITNLTLDGNTADGLVGLTTFFKERLEKLAKESSFYRKKELPELQEILFEEYVRLVSAGRGKALSSSIHLENTKFLLEVDHHGSAVIHAVARDAEQENHLKGIALAGLSDDPESVKFANKVKRISGIEIAMDLKDGTQDGLLTRPWMIDMGGGSNIPKSVRDYIAAKGEAKGRPCKKLLH